MMKQIIPNTPFNQNTTQFTWTAERIKAPLTVKVHGRKKYISRSKQQCHHFILQGFPRTNQHQNKSTGRGVGGIVRRRQACWTLGSKWSRGGSEYQDERPRRFKWRCTSEIGHAPQPAGDQAAGEEAGRRNGIDDYAAADGRGGGRRDHVDDCAAAGY
jgi:hypothetical protein